MILFFLALNVEGNPASFPCALLQRPSAGENNNQCIRDVNSVPNEKVTFKCDSSYPYNAGHGYTLFPEKNILIWKSPNPASHRKEYFSCTITAIEKL